MHRFRSVPPVVALLLAALASPSSAQAQSAPTAAPTLVGCFASSNQHLSDQGIYKYQSSGYCWGVCSKLNNTVLFLSDGDRCSCSDERPEASTAVNATKCSTPCEGYDLEDCGGGTSYWTVWLTGISDDVPTYNGGVSSSTSSTVSKTSTATSSPSRTATHSTSTSSPTASLSAASTNSSGSKKHSNVGTILGVVLGLTAFTAFLLVALILCCLWRRRRKTARSSPPIRPTSTANEPLRSVDDAESMSGSSFYSAEQQPGWVQEQAGGAAVINQHPSPQMAEVPEVLRVGHSGPSRDAFTPVQERSMVPTLNTEANEYNRHRNSDDWRRSSRHSSVPTIPFSPGISIPSPRPHGLEQQQSIDQVHSPRPPAIQQQQSFEQARSISLYSSSDEPAELAPPPAKHDPPSAVLYPSKSEIEGFDFSNMTGFQPLAKPQNWQLQHERRDGRHELA